MAENLRHVLRKEIELRLKNITRTGINTNRHMKTGTRSPLCAAHSLLRGENFPKKRLGPG